VIINGWRPCSEPFRSGGGWRLDGSFDGRAVKRTHPESIARSF
jgi:hypothetical protein